MSDTYAEGIKLYKSRNYKDALAVFLSLPEEEDVSNVDLAYYIGLSYARLNRYDEALLYLEQVVTAGTDIKRICQCRLTLAVIYNKTGRESLADFELQKLMESGYQTAEVFCTLAYTTWQQHKEKETILYYERALELKPDNPTALNGLGYVLACMEKDLTKALSYCKKALDSNPDSAAYLDSLGWVYYKLGLNKEALSYITRAKEKNSVSPEIAEHYEAISSNNFSINRKDRGTDE